LTYHAVDDRPSVISVSPGGLRRQLQLLSERRLQGISLAEAFAHREATGTFPPNAVVLTFDDGYLGVLEHALPILSANGFTATVFLVSGLVGLKAAAARARNPDFDRELLGWSQAAELVQAGWEIGSHSVGHPDLTRLDPAACERELRDSKTELEQRLQQPVYSLAYPYGGVSPRVRALTARYYRFACTTRLALSEPIGDPLRIDRIDMYYMQDERRFGKLLDGGLHGWLFLRRLLRRASSSLR
jgi:peptidoglycan/xylan/chitin deacetylase (PgdA/CDA1 family)